MNQSPTSPKILVAPLDWGLGHATRCIPLINELLLQGCEVVIAASGAPKVLLGAEFPALRTLNLPGYNMQYAATGWGLAVKIVAQIPKLLSAIKKEQAWLQKVVAQEKPDAIISDNRYGLFHAGMPSVFLTHQLRIKAPLPITETILQRLNYRFINRFSECWVPDAEAEPNLAGALSHPVNKPSIPLHYTGPLSRFALLEAGGEARHLLILLSGPEPQRTMLEQKIRSQLKKFTGPVVLVRGLPGNHPPLQESHNFVVHHHLPAADLAPLIKDASLVIARSGYSTVMDLAALQKRSILIPTPGQTEQEYLARYLMEKNFALCIPQKKFMLENALDLANHFPYFPYPSMPNVLRSTISAFVEKIRRTKA